MTFGQFIRFKRLKRGLSLREFCRLTHYDVGYISRLENEILPPPSEDRNLSKLAGSLQIKPKSKDWETFHDLGAIDRKKIPSDLARENSKLLNYLPAFLRKANKENISKKDVETFLKLIKGEDSKT